MKILLGVVIVVVVLGAAFLALGRYLSGLPWLRR